MLIGLIHDLTPFSERIGQLLGTPRRIRLTGGQLVECTPLVIRQFLTGSSKGLITKFAGSVPEFDEFLKHVLDLPGDQP